jgi:hypothetical protein
MPYPPSRRRLARLIPRSWRGARRGRETAARPGRASRKGWSECRWARKVHGHGRYDVRQNPGIAGASGRKARGCRAPVKSMADPAHDPAGRSAASVARPRSQERAGSAKAPGRKPPANAGWARSASACQAGSAWCRTPRWQTDRHKGRRRNRQTTARVRLERCACGRRQGFSRQAHPDHAGHLAAPSTRFPAALYRPFQGQAAFAARRAFFRGQTHPMK